MDIFTLIKDMREGVETLLSQVTEMEKLLDGAVVADGEGRFFASEAYARFHAFTGEGHRREPPSDGEWGELENLFRTAFSRYYQFVAIDHRLTRDQLRLCLLMRLSFPHYVMARVMGVDSGRVTRLKAQVNRRLFGDRLASTLECNFRLHF
jgi:hypothetical protein